MIHRTGDKIIVQDMTEQATRSKGEYAMAIEGSNIMSQKANGKDVNYFTCAFKIKSAEFRFPIHLIPIFGKRT